MITRALLLSGLLIASLAHGRENLWKQVEEARNNDQPKTEILLLERIEKDAFDAGAWAEGVRALAQRIATESRIEGRAEVIKKLDAAIDGAPEESKALLRALSAAWLHGYYTQNRWRFMQRSSTGSPPGDDFESWDLARILGEIDARFQASLADRENLRQAPIADFGDLLERGELDDAYRPTLYDFIAHEALGFHSSEEVAVSRPVDAFALDAASPVFGPVEDFLAWQPATEDESSPKYRALRIHQELIRFHRADEDPRALLAAELGRLRWAGEAADVAGRDEALEKALRAFIGAHPDQAISAWARVDLGELLLESEREKEAHAVFRAGAAAHPGHPFGKLCDRKARQLEVPVLTLGTETHWTPAGEEIHVTHSNLGRVWFRVYSMAFKPGRRTIQSDHYLPDREKWLPALLQERPVAAWSEELVDEQDFKQRQASFAAPGGLPDGYHVLVASADEEFSLEDNALAQVGVHVTPLALSTQRAEDGGIEGFVLDAVTGAPLAGVAVGMWQQHGEDIRDFSTRSDRDGWFRFAPGRGGSCLVIARQDFKRAVVRTWSSRQQVHEPRDQEQVVFFTDRSLYRPGQTVHFKGIRVLTNPPNGKYEVVGGAKGRVVLRDPNHKEVAAMEVVTNERGSFAASFTAPEGSVLGRCSLQLEGVHGQGWFRVEEYKRPKFFSEVDPPEREAALGGEVAVRVRAEGFTGAAIDGARVSWRVTREADLPVWARWCWWIPPITSPAEEIAHGVAETGTDGSVAVRFTAVPDPSVSEDLEPVFRFTVTADVTDPTGETRSATRVVRVARTGLRASLQADDWLESGGELEFRVRTESHDGEGRAASGTLKIHRLREPETCPRPPANGGGGHRPPGNPVDPGRWENGELVREFELTSDEEGKGAVAAELEAGAYRLEFRTRDDQGREVKALKVVQVVDPAAGDFPTSLPFHVGAPRWSVDPGGTARVLWASGHDEARGRIEWFLNGKLVHREWSRPGLTQQVFEFKVEDRHRGGLGVMVHQVTLNRAHRFQRVLKVPWKDKELRLRWERIVSKLEPGARETWTAVIEGPDGDDAAAEMVATLYDASLDAYAAHSFHDLGSFLRRESWRYRNDRFSSRSMEFSKVSGFRSPERYSLGSPFRHYRGELGVTNLLRFGLGFARGGMARDALFAMDAAPGVDAFAAEAAPAAPAANSRLAETSLGIAAKVEERADGAGPDPALDQVGLRENLNETAFFMPELTCDDDGRVRLTFTMPEALTKWRFLGMAHDAEFRSGLLEGETVTAKELMVQPNPPRFLREGDEIEFTVKVSNQGDERQSGTARLTLSDAASDVDRTAELGISAPEQPFEVPAGESRTLRWRVSVPDGAGFLKYKAVASSGNLGDGELGWLPVIPRRILVTESMSLPIRDPGTREFEFTKLLESGGSETLENQFVHLQVVSQPAWYAVMALPYLMEFPHECAEQTFNRYYANSLARHVATSDPKVRRIFEQWRRDGDALDSPLMKNQDLKGILLEETPWLAEAESEAEARRRVGVLFDDNRMERELEKAMHKLAGMQLADGMWPWFPGGRSSEYITLYITTGFGRLRALGVGTDITPALRALGPLDAALTRRHERILEDGDPEGNHLSPWIAHHLYTRSFFLKDRKLDARDRVAFDYFTGQARDHWTTLGSRMSRAHAALALHRLGDSATAGLITRSLKERAKVTEEQGMFWKDTEGAGWWWWQAPIETQAMMIEAFREVDADEEAVDDCQVWLIKQKQVADWRTTKATADAVHALLMGGRNLLSSDALLRVSLNGNEVDPGRVEAGTGMYEQRFVRGQVEPGLGRIELRKTDEGVAWASLHWQYLEDMAKVTAHEGVQLQLEKKLFVRRNTDEGPVLVETGGEGIAVGDELVTRVVVRNDRAMEFVHLKDLRGSGTEPLNVLSGHRWQDGVGYYEVTRDTATHFFIDRLPPGTHVFETSVRVQHAGKYQTGIAEIRCMYAPEFAAHSGSVGIEVD